MSEDTRENTPAEAPLEEAPADENMASNDAPSDPVENTNVSKINKNNNNNKKEKLETALAGATVASALSSKKNNETSQTNGTPEKAKDSIQNTKNNAAKNNTNKNTKGNTDPLKTKLQSEIQALEASIQAGECGPIQENIQKVTNTGSLIAKKINAGEIKEDMLSEEKSKLQAATKTIKAKCFPQKGGKRKTRKHKRRSRRV